MGRLRTGLISAGERAHLVGLDGRGMSGVAQLLHQRGFAVSGSIPTEGATSEYLRRLGVRVHAGHAPLPLPRSARLVVYGPDVPLEHPERLSARKLGVEQASCPEILGRLVRSGFGIAAVGGRRAGVTAAMLGWTLAHAGLDPTVCLGSHAPQLGGPGRQGSGPHVVVEATDHASIAEVAGADVVVILDDSPTIGDDAMLRRWAEAAPPGGYVLAEAGEAGPRGPGTWPGVAAEVERFSLEPGHAWWGADLKQDRGRYRFRAFHRGRFAAEIRLGVPGRHHVLAALATLAVCERVNLSTRAIREALEDFGGVSRGFESRGSYRGVTLVDDESRGHQGVGAALTLARQVYGRRRLCVAYRPDPVGMGECPGPSPGDFEAADRVLIVDEEGASDGSRADGLESGLRAAGTEAWRAAGIVEAIGELDRHLEPGDVLVTLGAGGVGTIADAFLRRVSRDRHG